jgi:hypothetical protein
VTLLSVASVDPILSIMALQRSMSRINFGRILLFTAEESVPLTKDIEVIKIEKFHSISEYSSFMIKELYKYTDSEFILIVQWDGFVIDAGAWSDDFLHYDYIGAPWVGSETVAVGNGGFSLRSRKLLCALAEPDIVVGHPEDVAICKTNRVTLEQNYGIKFPPKSLAARFSYERGNRPRDTFGFHGLYNFPHIAPTVKWSELSQIPRYALGSRDYSELISVYIKRRDGQSLLMAVNLWLKLIRSVKLKASAKSIWTTLRFLLGRV